MALHNDPYSIENVLRRKFGILDIDKAYLNIDYNKKTEFVDKHIRTVCHTKPYSELLRFAEETLMEEIP